MDSHLRRLGRPLRAVFLAIVGHGVLVVLLGLSFFLEPETIRPNPVIPINAVAVSEAAFNAETQKKERKEKLKLSLIHI